MEPQQQCCLCISFTDDSELIDIFCETGQSSLSIASILSKHFSLKVTN